MSRIIPLKRALLSSWAWCSQRQKNIKNCWCLWAEIHICPLTPLIIHWSRPLCYPHFTDDRLRHTVCKQEPRFLWVVNCTEEMPRVDKLAQETACASTTQTVRQTLVLRWCFYLCLNEESHCFALSLEKMASHRIWRGWNGWNTHPQTLLCGPHSHQEGKLGFQSPF